MSPWLCVLSVLCGARFHLNNIKIIFHTALALTGITSNLKFPKPPILSKSACLPPTPQEQAESDQDEHPNK